MRYTQILVEYDRARALDALGPDFWLAALRDYASYWHVNLNRFRSMVDAGDVKSLAKYKDPAAQQQIANEYMARIEAADPTVNKKYTQWMARQFMLSQNNVKLEDLESTVADYVAKFDLLNRKKRLASPFNDINRYKSLLDFMDKMDEYDEPFAEKKSGQARVVFDNSNVKVVVPEDKAAACAYGRQTRWCTAAVHGTNYFEQYNRQGPLYILLPKNPKYPGEKFQLHFASNQFMDEEDDPVSLKTLLTVRFPDLFDFFMQIEKESIGEYLVFTPDDILQPLTEKIGELLMEFANELFSEWEVNDDYYYSWLQSEGYVDPDTGEIADNAPSYFDYNDEARREYDNLVGAIVLSPDEVREIADEMGTDDSEGLSISAIEDVYIQSVKNVFGRSNGAADEMIHFITKHLIVFKDDTGQWSAKISKHRN